MTMEHFDPSELLAKIERQQVEIERLRNRVAELEEAIDSQEIDAGFTTNGNMWRFWSKKCREHLDKRKAAEAKLKAVLDREAETQRRHEKKLAEVEPVMCGGCGETNPDRRCIGCLHPFYPDPAQ